MKNKAENFANKYITNIKYVFEKQIPFCNKNNYCEHPYFTLSNLYDVKCIDCKYLLKEFKEE